MTPLQHAATAAYKAKANPAANVHADAYIAEREEKRRRGIDVPRHRRHRQGDEGHSAYAGTRQVGGQSLALLKKHGQSVDEIIVIPVDEATAKRLGRLKVGDPLTLKPDGSVHATSPASRKGRSR